MKKKSIVKCLICKNVLRRNLFNKNKRIDCFKGFTNEKNNHYISYLNNYNYMICMYNEYMKKPIQINCDNSKFTIFVIDDIFHEVFKSNSIKYNELNINNYDEIFISFKENEIFL